MTTRDEQPPAPPDDEAATLDQLTEMEAARKLWWSHPQGQTTTVLETLLTGHLAGTPPGETLH